MRERSARLWTRPVAYKWAVRCTVRSHRRPRRRVRAASRPESAAPSPDFIIRCCKHAHPEELLVLPAWDRQPDCAEVSHARRRPFSLEDERSRSSLADERLLAQPGERPRAEVFDQLVGETPRF
jgi:hypothetical protein